ncbi:MAG: type IV pilus twitching motility protein PilT [Planctomycetes bacterium]|nr:type IV pilus twitching motility protein PilT [Planctomycetota bacterium]
MEFHEMLRKMVIEKASDLFLKVGTPPCLRIDGAVHFLDAEELTPQDLLEIHEFIEDTRRDGLPKAKEVDVSFEVPGVGRFRANIYFQRGNLGLVLRHVLAEVPAFEDLSLPSDTIRKLATRDRGLILVTGNTGSGKSTTLASMVNYINENFNKHIITIEDPIEFVFKDKKSVIDQREVGTDTADFLMALKHAVRQSPDVILIGEMRDRETVEAALAASETGHLVMSTLHTINASQTVERIINFFPPHQHALIRLQLSLCMAGIVSQRLLPKKNESGRVPAVEILAMSPTIQELVREGHTTALPAAMKDGDFFGCMTFNQSLKKLHESDRIRLDVALAASDYPEELKLDLKGITRNAAAMDFNFNY